MAGVLLVGAVVAMAGEASPQPAVPGGVNQALGNMEGKEVRFGAAARWSVGRRDHRHQHGRRQRDA